jgi:phenylacetate-coenzyme A ligase PaaK-like adenylate-forming protein
MLRELMLGYPYIEKKRLLRRTEFWPLDKLQELQGDMLLAILRFSAKNIKFYSEAVGQKYYQTEDPYELLKLFPLIEKSEIKNKVNMFLNGKRWRYLKVTTGGSTGQPFSFYFDRFKTRQAEKAFIFDQWKRVGYKFGDSIFNLRGRIPAREKFYEHDRNFNIYYVSSFNINIKNIKNYINNMNKIRPKFLHGYPSTIYQIAVLMEQTKLNLDFKFKAVFCGSEKLFDYQRKKIKSVFKTKIYNWYGHSEYLALGGECEHSNRYHFFPQYGYSEFLPTGQKNNDGKEIFELVATGFNNQVMPLIRYRTGDYAILSDENYCKCGRHYLMVDEIIGRKQEFLIDFEGALISATSLIFGQHYEAFEVIDALKIYQKKKGEIEIHFVKNQQFKDKLLDLMRDKIELILGKRLKVDFVSVDNIPKSPIGKAKLVEQEIDVNEYLQ